MPIAAPPVIAPSALRRHLWHRGGVTLDPLTGASLHAGIAICPHHRWSRSLRWPAFDDGAIGDCMHRLQRHLLPGRYLGAWVEPGHGRVWIEAVLVLPGHHAERAMRLADAAGQRAVYDLGRGRLIPVVGTA